MKEVRKKRKLTLAFGLVIYVCLGFLYSWSNFVSPMEVDEGWNRTETALAFTICMVAYGLSCVFGGLLAKKFGVINVIRIGSVLLFIGLFGTGFSTTKMMLYIFYGVIYGFGTGSTYVAGMSAIQNWFPDKIGIVTGLLLTLYGLGGSFLGTISVKILLASNWELAFKIMGILIFVLVLVSSWFVKPPTNEEQEILDEIERRAIKKEKNTAILEETIEIGPREMLKRKSFYLYFFWFVLIAAFWIGAVGEAAAFALDLGASIQIATLTSGVLNFCNGFGRLIIGYLHDHIARRKIMMVVSIGIVVAAVFMYFALNDAIIWLLIISVGIIGLAYGGAATTNAVFIRRFYGDNNYSQNFGIVSCNGIFSAFMGGTIGPLLVEKTGNFQLMMIYFVSLVIIAFFLQFGIKKP